MNHLFVLFPIAEMTHSRIDLRQMIWRSILLALIRNQETRFTADDIIMTGATDFNSKVYFTETDLQTNHFQIFMMSHTNKLIFI